MQYRTLAETYEELNATMSKLAKADIVAKLLKKTPSDEIEKVTLLLSGRIFPEWSDQKIGVAEKLVIKAIAKATGSSVDNIVKEFEKTGDLGFTAENLIEKKKQLTLDQLDLTVKLVFENLTNLAQQEGSGSQEKKLDLISELLSAAEPLEARYVIRTILEQLRVGVAKGIIRDAIAQAFEVDKKIVESAWQSTPNYGLIAKTAKTDGEKGLKKIGVVIGEPFQVALAEKVPDLKDAFEKFSNLLLEYKYDGMRILIHKKGDKVWLFTRNLEDITKQFPDIVELVRKNIKADKCIIDGEAVGLTEKGKPIPFQKLSTRIKRKYDIEKQSAEIPVQVNLFDVIYADGKFTTELPLHERKKILAKLVTSHKGKFQIAKGLIPKDLAEAQKFYDEALKMGHEGLIAKNLDAVYVPGRKVAGGWLKIKPTMENLDLVIIGGVWGTGKRAGTFGSLILGLRNKHLFQACGKLGTGLKEKEGSGVTLQHLAKILKPLVIEENNNEIKFKPEILIEVAYEEIQKSPQYESGFALRFPRFIRLREDKSAKDADDINRINVLYKQQKGKR